MGKYEVLTYLLARRMQGYDDYYSAAELCRVLSSDGKDQRLFVIWYAVCGLSFDGLLETSMVRHGLQWSRRYRAKVSSDLQVSSMQPHNNNYRELVGKSRRTTKEEQDLVVLGRRVSQMFSNIAEMSQSNEFNVVLRYKDSSFHVVAMSTRPLGGQVWPQDEHPHDEMPDYVG